MKPFIFINFKAYNQAIGANAIKLAKKVDSVAKKTKKSFIISVEATDIYPVVKAVKIPVWAEHISAKDPGSSTGHVILEAVKAVGAKGSLINHSERRLDKKTIQLTIEKARKHKFPVILCVQSLAEAKKYAKFKPNFIAYEPKALIGGTVSVSQSKPQVIEEIVKAVPKVPILVGAGVHNAEDVRVAVKLGAKGVLLASAVTKAAKPEKILLDLAKGL